jgi:hypothetical protein
VGSGEKRARETVVERNLRGSIFGRGRGEIRVQDLIIQSISPSRKA